MKRTFGIGPLDYFGGCRGGKSNDCYWGYASPQVCTTYRVDNEEKKVLTTGRAPPGHADVVFGLSYSIFDPGQNNQELGIAFVLIPPNNAESAALILVVSLIS